MGRAPKLGNRHHVPIGGDRRDHEGERQLVEAFVAPREPEQQDRGDELDQRGIIGQGGGLGDKRIGL